MTSFGAFLRRLSSAQLLRGMVLENLALDVQLRAEGLLPALDMLDPRGADESLTQRGLLALSRVEARS